MRAHVCTGIEVELVLPWGNRLRKNPRQSRQGRSFSVQAMDVSAEGEAYWHGAPGMGQVHDLVVATQLVEADHGRRNEPCHRAERQGTTISLIRSAQNKSYIFI